MFREETEAILLLLNVLYPTFLLLIFYLLLKVHRTYIDIFVTTCPSSGTGYKVRCYNENVTLNCKELPSSQHTILYQTTVVANMKLKLKLHLQLKTCDEKYS